MPRENIISGGLDDAFGGSNKPAKKSRVSGKHSEEIIDDFGNELGGNGSYAGKGGIKKDIDRRGERGKNSEGNRPDNSGIFESSIGSRSGRGSPKFTSSSSISRGTDIFDTDFGSARGNRLTPKSRSSSGSSETSKRESPAREEVVYGSEPPKPKSTDEYLTNDDSDIFSDGFGSDEAGWMMAKRKFGEKRYEKRLDEKPAATQENLSIGGNDIFATNIAVNPLEMAEEKSVQKDISKEEPVFGTEAHYEPAPSPYGEELPDERSEPVTSLEITGGIVSESSEVTRDAENAGNVDNDNNAADAGAEIPSESKDTGAINIRSGESEIRFGKDTSDDLYDDDVLEPAQNRPKAVAYTMEDDMRAQRQNPRTFAGKMADNKPVRGNSGDVDDIYGDSGSTDIEYDEYSFDELTTPVDEPQNTKQGHEKDSLYNRLRSAAGRMTPQRTGNNNSSGGNSGDIYDDSDASMQEDGYQKAKKFNYMETDDSDLFED